MERILLSLQTVAAVAEAAVILRLVAISTAETQKVLRLAGDRFPAVVMIK